MLNKKNYSKLKSLKGKDQATPLDLFTTELLTELGSINDEISMETPSNKRRKLSPINFIGMKKPKVLEHKLRPIIEIEQKNSYTFDEVLEVINELDKGWENYIDKLSPNKNFLQFYVS
jgi:hypothetical protein